MVAIPILIVTLKKIKAGNKAETGQSLVGDS